MAMISIPNNLIVINRGDSYSFSVDLYDDDNNLYRLKGDDALYFGLMDPNQPFEDALVKKKFIVEDYIDGPDGDSTIIDFEITPEDTLDLFPGKYYYAIKLKQDHYLYNEETEEQIKVEGVKTVVNKAKFIICD